MIQSYQFMSDMTILQHVLTFFDSFMKMQGQKGKCKEGIKSYSLDRFEQVERSKNQPEKQGFELFAL